jgi:hypothetical protein
LAGYTRYECFFHAIFSNADELIVSIDFTVRVR